jgi:dTDP-glucose pyrophosphorylase
MRREDRGTALDAPQAAAADAGLKAMIPVGRPFLDYVLSGMADAGFDEACLVTGPEHETVREYYTKTIRPQRIAVSFAIQAEPVGTANAVLAAEEFVGHDEFLVINSDDYYPAEALAWLQSLGQPATVLFPAEVLVRQSNIPQERIREFAYCAVDGEGFLADIMEKPEFPYVADFSTGKLVSMNCWRFGRNIFDACRKVPLSSRHEYELPQAVKLAIQGGARFKVGVSSAGVLDLTQRSDIAAMVDRLRDVEVHL